MAVRFFERIAKTYRRERWGAMHRPLLTTWYKCAQRLGDVELSVRILVEMLAHGMPCPYWFGMWPLTRKYGSGAHDDEDDDAILQEDLLAVLKVGLIFTCCVQPFSVAQSTVPSTHEEPLSVDLSDSEPICMPTSSDPVYLLIELCES
jgi:hypothetical protein